MQTLLGHDLVDEVRLTVFPDLLGSGERLFGPAVDRMPLRLLDTESVGSSLVRLTYRPVRPGGR